MIKRKALVWLLCGLLLRALPLCAQDRNAAPVVGVMLKNSIGAVSSALGASTIVSTYNSYGELSNPAFVAFNPTKAGFGINYNPWVIGVEGGDLFNLGLDAFYKTSDNQGVFLKANLFNIGDILLVSDDPLKGGTSLPVNTFDFSVTGGYAYSISPSFSIAAGVKYFHSRTISSYAGNNVNTAEASVVAGDLYLLYSMVPDSAKSYGINASIVFANMGTKASYFSTNNPYFIPAYVGVGVSFSKYVQSNTLRFLAEVKKDLVPYAPNIGASAEQMRTYYSQSVFDSWTNALGQSTLGFSFGAEFVYSDMLSFRLGYYNDNFSYYSRDAFTLGLGYIAPFGLGFNFAYWIPGSSYVTSSRFINTFSISLTYDIY